LLLLAVSDVHSPRYLMQYMARLSARKALCGEAIAIVWAGDMVEKGRVAALQPVVTYTRRICGNKRIIAVFGNEEYMDLENEFMRRYHDIIWLNDNYIRVEVEGKCIAFYGTRGALDEPTRWQKRHIPNIRAIYKAKIERFRSIGRKLRSECDILILVTHYVPTYATLEGESREIWPQLGSKEMEKAVIEVKPDIVIHGHAHNSKKLEAELDGVRVYNVALPARNDITVIEVQA
jgi:Icc-related predicted phosphoesterase